MIEFYSDNGNDLVFSFSSGSYDCVFFLRTLTKIYFKKDNVN